METVTKYVCEYCGKEFAIKEECEACEATHMNPHMILPVWDVVSVDNELNATPLVDSHQRTYPAAIVCTFKSNKHILYTASKFVDDIKDAVSNTFVLERRS